MKKHHINTIILIALSIIATWSCERDDICAETTTTTPHLNIRFYDANDPDALKVVRQLTARALDDDDNNLDDITVSSPFDSISLPLRTIEGQVTTRFAFEKDTDYRLDDIATTESNIDIVEITYTPEFVYVSRACGYKSIYTNLSVTIEPDGNNWILTNEILTTTIENENEAHIILRH